jgi:hypothetical protein
LIEESQAETDQRGGYSVSARPWDIHGLVIDLIDPAGSGDLTRASKREDDQWTAQKERIEP